MRSGLMPRRLWAVVAVVSLISNSACDNEAPPPSRESRLSEAIAPLIYSDPASPFCTDMDPNGQPYSGPPTNAGPRPTWSSTDIQHPVDTLDDDNNPSTPDINLRQLPTYRDITHNLNFLQSLRFLISVVTRITSALENAQEYIDEGEYVDTATGWLNDQIPQTTGHCICMDQCGGGCDPANVVDNAQNALTQIMDNLDFEQLLTDFLNEKVNATIAELDALANWFVNQFNPGSYLTDPLGQDLSTALEDQLTTAAGNLASGVNDCDALTNPSNPDYADFQAAMDQAVNDAMANLDTAFSGDIQNIMDMIALYDSLGAALPELQQQVTDLWQQFQGVEKLEDLFSVDWSEVQSIVTDIQNTANTVWPDIQNVLDNDWTAFWDNLNPLDTNSFAAQLDDLMQQAYNDALTSLQNDPTFGTCITALLDDNNYANPGTYGASDFEAGLQGAFYDAIETQWQATKDQIEQTINNIQDMINGIGQDALSVVTDLLEDVKDEILAAALDGCYMRGFRSDCFDFCNVGGTVTAADADQCFLWIPVDFLQQPAATAASATLFALEQTGFLDTAVQWIQDNIAPYLSGALGALANATGSIGETLQKINDIFSTIFTYIDRFSEGYHLGAYNDLRPDLHMCIGYAGHGAYAQLGNLGGDNFSIGARYTSHNISAKHRVQFRSGGFAVSAFGHELSLAPTIEVNTQIHGFKLWDIRRPLGIPLNVSINDEALARLDVFNNIPFDNSPDPIDSPYGLIIDQGNGLPLGALIVRDLWPVRDAANQVIWPRPEVSDVIDPANTPDAPEWESDSIAVVSLGLNLPIDYDPPRVDLPSIPIIPGVLTVVPYFDIAAGVSWTHQTDLYVERIVEKVNENLPASDQLAIPDDLRRDMHAMQADDLTGDDGTAAYVEPELGFDIFLGFKIWKIRIGAYASLGLAVNIRPGGFGGIVDLNTALADELLHVNPPADAPCEPVLETKITESCNNLLLSGEEEPEYSCEPAVPDSSCCIRVEVLTDPPQPQGEELAKKICADDWTQIDAQLCKDINSTGKSIDEVMANLSQVPQPIRGWIEDALSALAGLVSGNQTAYGFKIQAQWNQGVPCSEAQCFGDEPFDLSTELLAIGGISECEMHGYCTHEDGSVTQDTTEECCGATPPGPDAAPRCLIPAFKAVDIGEMICGITSSADADEDGRVRCWLPGGVPAALDGGDVPSNATGGRDFIECDSSRCAWGLPPTAANDTDYSGAHTFGLDGAIHCDDPLVDCDFADASVRDEAHATEDSVVLGNVGFFDTIHNTRCPLVPTFGPGDLFYDNPRYCQADFLAQRLACEYLPAGAPFGCNPSGAGATTPLHQYFQVEYDSLTMCAIEIIDEQAFAQSRVTPVENMVGGPVACAFAASVPAPFDPLPGDVCDPTNPDQCPAGYRCHQVEGQPTCVLEFAGGAAGFNHLYQPIQPLHDAVDVAMAGDATICGIHDSDSAGNPLGIDCYSYAPFGNPCDPDNLEGMVPDGQFRDIESAGVCTICGLRLDGSEIVCWGDEVGTNQTYTLSPPAGASGPELFVDMGGLMSGFLPRTNPQKFVVCGVTQSGKITCSDTRYQPDAGKFEGDPGIFTPYQCVEHVDVEISDWVGSGCHPLQQGFGSACGCLEDADCSAAAGETCNTDAGRCMDSNGASFSCECDPSGGGCPAGRVCADGACALECTFDADCPGGLICGDNGSGGGGCVPEFNIPWAEEITWGMSNVDPPMHTINTYAMADIFATLILKFSAGVEATFKLFGKEKTWEIFKYAEAWDLGSTWKGWYQPGLEARYQDECADPDLTTPVTNRFPRSLTSNPYDAAFDAAGINNLFRNCPNGGVCRYKDPLPASQSQPWEYTDGNVGTVEEFVQWCKEDMPEHMENPVASSPEDIVGGLVDTVNFGTDLGFTIYAQSQPCVDGKPVLQWIEDLYPTYDDQGNVVDEGALGDYDCTYDDPQTGQQHTFPCTQITENVMRIWGCLDKDANPYAQALWDAFPELQVTTDPDGSPHDYLDIDTMFWPQPHTTLAFDYSPQTMKPQYANYYVWQFPFTPMPIVGVQWLQVVEDCFDGRYNDPVETRCECAADADCDEGQTCGGAVTGCVEQTGAAAQCPIVYVDLGVEGCCGDGVVQSEPVMVMAPAEPGSAFYDSYGCADPAADHYMCTGLYYYEECDDGPEGSENCSPTCKIIKQQPEGACCTPGGGCFENLNPEECHAQEGTFNDGTSCAELSYCAPERGACCLPDGACVDLEERDCLVKKGSFQAGKSCENAELCATPSACCFADGGCQNMPASKCILSDGMFQAGVLCGEAGACGCTPIECPLFSTPIDTNGDACPDSCCERIICKKGQYPIDTDGDGCMDGCCKRKRCKKDEYPLDPDGDGCFDKCCKPKKCKKGQWPIDPDGDGCFDKCCRPAHCKKGEYPLDPDGDGCFDKCCKPKRCKANERPFDSDGDGCDDSCIKYCKQAVFGQCAGYDYSEQCNPKWEFSCIQNGAILGDQDCDGKYDVCQICPDNTHPVDYDGDGCHEACDCCKKIKCKKHSTPIDSNGDGCFDSCCQPLLCPLGATPIDKNGDGCNDACCDQLVACPRGYVAFDKDGDGCPDSCRLQITKDDPQKLDQGTSSDSKASLP